MTRETSTSRSRREDMQNKSANNSSQNLPKYPVKSTKSSRYVPDVKFNTESTRYRADSKHEEKPKSATTARSKEPSILADSDRRYSAESGRFTDSDRRTSTESSRFTDSDRRISADSARLTDSDRRYSSEREVSFNLDSGVDTRHRS